MLNTTAGLSVDRVRVKKELFMISFFSRLETDQCSKNASIYDHTVLLDSGASCCWKHQIQISALFLVLLETTERFQCKNDAKRKSLPKIIVLLTNQIIRINI